MNFKKISLFALAGMLLSTSTTHIKATQNPSSQMANVISYLPTNEENKQLLGKVIDSNKLNELNSVYKYDLMKYAFNVRKGAIILESISNENKPNITPFKNKIINSNAKFDPVYELLLKKLETNKSQELQGHVNDPMYLIKNKKFIDESYKAKRFNNFKINNDELKKALSKILFTSKSDKSDFWNQLSKKVVGSNPKAPVNSAKRTTAVGQSTSSGTTSGTTTGTNLGTASGTTSGSTSTSSTSSALTNDSKLHFISVNGDCILVESKDSNNVIHYGLIDAGEDKGYVKDGTRGYYALDEEKVLKYLDAHMVKNAQGKLHFDWVLGTHAHSDHIGGMDKIVNDPRVSISQGILRHYDASEMNAENKEWNNQEVYNDLVGAFSAHNIPVIAASEDINNKDASFGELNIKFFPTDDKFRKLYNVNHDENENSIITLITDKKTSNTALLTADTNYSTFNGDNGDEEYIIDRLKANNVSKINIFKLAHHGNAGSNSDALLNYANPDVLVATSTTSRVDNVSSWIKAHPSVGVAQMVLNDDMIANMDGISTSFYGLSVYNMSKDPNIFQWVNLPNGDVTLTGWKGARSIGPHFHDDHWYLFDSTGILRKNAEMELWHKLFLSDENGFVRSGIVNYKGQDKLFNNYKQDNQEYGELVNQYWVKIGEEWYYGDKEGNLVKDSWINYKGKDIYLKNDGQAASGWEEVDGKWYFFDSKNNTPVKGWINDSGEKYYIDKDSGEVSSGWTKIDGKWYFFDKNNNTLKYGWLKDAGKWYYLKSDSGEISTKWNKIKSTWFWFSKSGALWTKVQWEKSGKNWMYSNGSNGYVTGKKIVIKSKSYEFDTNAYWKTKK